MKFIFGAHAAVNSAFGGQVPCLFFPDYWDGDNIFYRRSSENGFDNNVTYHFLCMATQHIQVVRGESLR